MEGSSRQVQTPKPTRTRNGGSSSRAPVDKLASLDMSEQLRAMLESAQSPDVLPHLCLDLRGRVDQALSVLSDLETLSVKIGPLSLQATEAQESSADLKKQVDDLRGAVQELTRDTSQEASAHDAELLFLRQRIQDIAGSVPKQDTATVMDAKLASLHTSQEDHRSQVAQILAEVKKLQDLTKSLSAENTLLRGRLRDLEMTQATPLTRAPDQASMAQPLVVEAASQAFPPVTTSPIRFPPARGPTYEEYLAGIRAPIVEQSPQPQVPLVAASTRSRATVASLVTTCDKPTPIADLVPQDSHQGIVEDQEGPYCPGLTPHVPMLTPFKVVVSYRHYRLKDTRATLLVGESEKLYRIKKRFDALYPTFKVFDGKKPIKLLEFLATLREGLDALHVSEALALLALACYLDGQAKTHYTALTSPGVRTASAALGNTWPGLVDSFLKRYLTDDVLQAAYDKVTDAKQKQDEDEITFADRLVTDAREACNVFTDRELVNYFIRGLLPSTRDAVTERVRQLPTQDQGDIMAARRVAQAEGNTYRARRSASAPSTPRSKAKTPAMLVTEDFQADNMTPGSSPPWSPWNRGPQVSGQDSYWAQLRQEDPEQAARIAQNLGSLLFVGSKEGSKTSSLPPSSPTSNASIEDMMNRTHVDVPELTKEQYQDAITVIPADYWSLNCWTCKTDGHTTFTCPSLTPAQRLYFAYCYFLHQCKGHPAMRDWLHQRYAKRIARNQEQDGQDQAPRPAKGRGSPRPRPGDKNSPARPYQNRLKREKSRNVHFGKPGVFIATQVNEALPAHSWKGESESDTTDSEKAEGQE